MSSPNSDSNPNPIPNPNPNPSPNPNPISNPNPDPKPHQVIIEISKPARERTLLKSKSVLKSTSDLFLKPAQPRQTPPSKMRPGSAVVAEERVLLEGRMSVRSSCSPFHVRRHLL